MRDGGTRLCRPPANAAVLAAWRQVIEVASSRKKSNLPFRFNQKFLPRN